MRLSDLTQAALLGTDRKALPPAPSGTKLGFLAAQLDPAQKERSLLSASVLALASRRAGELPSRSGQPAAPPCLPENQPHCNPQAGVVLRRILEGEQPELLPEWLALAKASNQLARPEHLPGLLAQGRSQIAVRERILPVLGQRGLWLAQQNTDWSWVAGATEEESVWQTGEKNARLLFLRRTRQTNPGRARELLESTWKQETPEDRASFITEFSEGLAPEDESFLEAALDDKRKDVRRVAAKLLAGIPGSALVQRMIERTRPRLKFTPAENASVLKPKRTPNSTVELSLPETLDRGMARDGIEAKPPHGFGERFWWLIQMLAVVPLNTWTEAWGVSPAEIISGSAGDWDMFESWARAAAAQRNEIWADLLFQVALDRNRGDKFADLLGALTAERRDNRLTQVLASENSRLSAIQSILVTNCDDDFGPDLSRRVLAWLQRVISQNILDWQVRGKLKSLACQLHPSILHEVPGGWPTDSRQWDSWAKGIEDFINAAQFRADMHASFHNQVL